MANNMKNFNCDMIQFAVSFNEKDFKKKEFLDDIEETEKESEDFALFSSFGSKFKTKKEHAHVLLNFDDDDECLLKFGFHLGENNNDNTEHYIEDIANWLGSFFYKEKVVAEITSIFVFENNFESRVQLDYPLLIESDLFQNSRVIGYDIDFPDESSMNRASISQVGKRLLVMLFGNSEIDFSSFNYLSEIKKLGSYTEALILQREKKR